jgi:hypothetical protein
LGFWGFGVLGWGGGEVPVLPSFDT